MDSFIIKVFLAKCEAEKFGVSPSGTKPKHQTSTTCNPYKIMNGRSYKEVLLHKDEFLQRNLKPKHTHDLVHSKSSNVGKENQSFDPFHFSIPQEDLEWLKQCVVGQVKGMYDAPFVQILINASQSVNVLPMVNIFVNNVRYYIKTSLAAYEDQRCWIDGGLPNPIFDESSED
ncbi:hypothetical protein V6N12_050136 [Hibiscus sabdariffa]|uniref:Uncharacterized protein n=1 Tax=Hibiscus sabdariffa TaxID=183260 RepID=A0ABR2GBU5_9ROSI